MAYNNSNSISGKPAGNFRQPVAATKPMAQQAETTAPKVEALFSTGLFPPDKEGVASIGSVQLKEDLHLPAGSYMNIYHVTERKEGGPAYRLRVTPGKKKA